MSPCAKLFAVTLTARCPASWPSSIKGSLADNYVQPTRISSCSRTSRMSGSTSNASTNMSQTGGPTRSRLVDFSVVDLPEAEQQLRDLGAEFASHQPGGERFRVFIPILCATWATATQYPSRRTHLNRAEMRSCLSIDR